MLEGIITGDYQQLALFLLRVVLGITFIAHGWPKITNLTGTREGFSQMGVPVPGLTSLYAALAEFIGGILVVLGFYSGWAALALAVNMLRAMLFVKWKQPFKGGWELDLALFIMAVTILLAGPGAYNLASYWTWY
ncbi:MAG: DoxX family protein [Candidatus Portnoybacteria bacterium]|nr:DoxX family protein [Candidatus Portnoybacteria bacterium]